MAVSKVRALCAAAVLVGALWGSAANAQIVNGNFDVGNPFTDWTPSGAPGSVSFINTGAQSPTQSILFFGSTGSITQTFNATPGQYFLSFFLRAISNAPLVVATINVIVNGITYPGSAFGSDYGYVQTAPFTLNATGNTITFLNPESLFGQQIVQLDTVGLTAVAVPGPLAGSGALAFAFGGAFFAFRRMRKASDTKAA